MILIVDNLNSNKYNQYKIEDNSNCNCNCFFLALSKGSDDIYKGINPCFGNTGLTCYR